MSTTYNIIFNGYTLYVVIVNADGITVRYGDGRTPSTLIQIPKYKRILRGDNRFFQQEYLNMNLYYPTSYDFGNALLVEIRDGLYMLITGDIYLFESAEPIDDFYSVITHSDMTIPVMIGVSKSVYCFYWGPFKFPKNDTTIEPIFHSYDTHLREAERIELQTVIHEYCSHNEYYISGKTHWEAGDFWAAMFSTK